MSGQSVGVSGPLGDRDLGRGSCSRQLHSGKKTELIKVVEVEIIKIFNQ